MILSLSILLTAFLAAFAILRNRDALLFFRMTALVFSIAVVFMFNANWLTRIVVKDWAWPILFFLLFILALSIRGLNILLEIRSYFLQNLKAIVLSFFVIALAFLFASSYFHWDLNIPRYSTPDSGTHFLYMHSTSQNGVMSMFGRNLIADASGDTTIAPGHNQTYFPGATAAFSLLDMAVHPKNPAMTLQIFNVFFYAILAGYFIFLFHVKRIITNKISLVCLSGIILFGTFFNFVATSHSTQLLGLLFLLAFMETYESYLNKKEYFFVPALFLGAMVLTYFYWLPIAIIFVTIELLLSLKKSGSFSAEFLRALFVGATGIVFCLGYVLIMFKLNMFQYASSDGGVAFQDKMLSDTLLVLPIVIYQLFSLLRGQHRIGNSRFTIAFFGSILVFSLTLALLYKSGLFVSHYTAMKVLYIAVPSAWVLAFLFLGENIFKIKNFWKLLIGRKWKTLEMYKIFFIGTIFCYAAVWGIAKKFDLSLDFLPLLRANIQQVTQNDMQPALSGNQMKLLDEIKSKHPSLLQDGKIFVMGPRRNVLWIFAYSGIWARSSSLIQAGILHVGSESEMHYFYSNSDDYITWLNQDEKHAIVYFNANDSDSCTDCNLFDFGDYNKLESEGDNHLLQLKSGTNPIYEYKLGALGDTQKVFLPIKYSFMADDQSLTGMSLKLRVRQKKNVQSDVLLELFAGDCSKNESQKIAAAIVAKEDLIKSGDRKISFEHAINSAKNQTFCVKLTSADEKTSSAVGLGRFSNGGFEVQPIYAYQPEKN